MKLCNVGVLEITFLSESFSVSGVVWVYICCSRWLILLRPVVLQFVVCVWMHVRCMMLVN